jgi:hypothetical protein
MLYLKDKQLADGNFFYSGPHLAFAFSSPVTYPGQELLLLDHNEWRAIGVFVARLGNGSAGGCQNFADKWPGLMFRIGNTRIFAVDHYTEEGVSRRGDGTGGAGVSRELQAHAEGFIIEDGGRQLAGWWFYGQGSWADASCWNHQAGNLLQQLPGLNSNVVVAGVANINPAEHFALNVGECGSGGQITLLAGQEPALRLMASGAFSADVIFDDFSDGQPCLLVEATGSLIHNSAGVNAIRQWQMQGPGLWPPAWNSWKGLSSPVKEQLPWQPSWGAEFQGWNPQQGQWYTNSNPLHWIQNNGSDHLLPGRGYRFSSQHNAMYLFQGGLNVEAVQVKAAGKWHLLGNPFSAAVDWDHPYWVRQNVNPVAQVWNSQRGSWELLLPGMQHKVEACREFMVENTGTGLIQVVIPPEARVHGNWECMPGVPQPGIQLLATCLQTGSKQQTMLLYSNDDFQQLQACFLPGLAPWFYSTGPAGEMALQYIPQVFPELVIPLGFVCQQPGQYSIEEVQGYQGGTLYLLDKKLLLVHALNTPYQFVAHPADDQGRFELHFRPGPVNDHHPVIAPVRVLANAYEIFVDMGYEAPGAGLMVCCMQGRRHISLMLPEGRFHRLAHKLPKGVFLVSIVNQGQQELKKVVIL